MHVGVGMDMGVHKLFLPWREIATVHCFSLHSVFVILQFRFPSRFPKSTNEGSAISPGAEGETQTKTEPELKEIRETTTATGTQTELTVNEANRTYSKLGECRALWGRA